MATVSALRRNTEKTEGVRTGWEIVSPETATKWLEGNTHNRPIRDSVVRRYAADMKEGRWKQTHQGIAFDESGTLIDGQHRLYAILEAGVPILLQVTRGLPMESQTVVDDGLKRSLVDILKVNDSARMADITALHGSVSARMRAGLSSTKADPRTRQELAEFLLRHWDAIHFAVGMFPVSKRVRGVISAAPVAVIARGYYHVELAKLTRFGQVLLDGVNRSDDELPIIVLRNWLLTRKANSGDEAARECYGKAERALLAYHKGEVLKRGHLYAVTEEAFPLPVKNGGDIRRR